MDTWTHGSTDTHAHDDSELSDKDVCFVLLYSFSRQSAYVYVGHIRCQPEPYRYAHLHWDRGKHTDTVTVTDAHTHKFEGYAERGILCIRLRTWPTMAPWDLVIKRLLASAFTSFLRLFSFLNVAQCYVAMVLLLLLLLLALSLFPVLPFPYEWFIRRQQRSSVHGHPCIRIRVLELISIPSRRAQGTCTATPKRETPKGALPRRRTTKRTSVDARGFPRKSEHIKY